MSMLIHFRADKDFRTPWPVQVDDQGVVTTGLGRDDGANLIGFGPLGEQRITVYPIAVWDRPEAAVGLVPTFASKDGEGPFEWQCIVSEVLIYTRKPQTGVAGDTPGGDATPATT
jgi:hypothetical protein